VDDRYLYVDEGISGRSAEKRPAFMRMIAQAKSRERPFGVILVHKFVRFARSREDSVVYKSLLRRECGVRVISVTESMEDDKFSVILESMLEAIAEYYSINLAEEVKKGMTEKALRGGLQTAPPFGYAVKDHILVPVPREADLVREIFKRFISGQGYYAIAVRLNENGVRTKRGSLFENRAVEYILRNPVYIGRLRWNPAGRSRRDYDNKDIIQSQAEHEPLISMETWEAAQQRAREIKAQWSYHGRPPGEKTDWISGLVRCAACGSPLVFSKPCYWKCSAYTKGACGHSQHIKDDLLKEAVLLRLLRDTGTDYPIDYEISRRLGPDEVGLLQRKKERLEERIARLREAFLYGADTAEEYKTMKQALQEEINGLEKKLSRLRDAPSADEPGRKVRDACEKALRVLFAPDTPLEQKRAAASCVIEACVWDKSRNNLSIRYREVF
jgi:DNA invertase Pin-like site-specific DNA recombinase